jgi:hypothetical protein
VFLSLGCGSVSFVLGSAMNGRNESGWCSGGFVTMRMITLSAWSCLIDEVAVVSEVRVLAGTRTSLMSGAAVRRARKDY